VKVTLRGTSDYTAREFDTETNLYYYRGRYYAPTPGRFLIRNVDELLAMLRSSATSYYEADGVGSITSVSNGAGALAQTYSFDSLGNQTGAASYYHADGLGSVTSLSNSGGALAQTYTFDSFGKQTASSGSLTNPFQYTAKNTCSGNGCK